MRVSGKTYLAVIIGMLVLCVAVPAVAAEGEPSGSLLPPGLVIKNVFAPGAGLPVGSVGDVQGEVLLIHAGEAVGYKAVKGRPLFKGDTIITREGGKVRFTLNDGSEMTLSSETTLVITQSIYDPARNTRSSFIDMGVGKARFIISKLVGSGSLNFKVKTATAVCGVRGSDFVLSATLLVTEATALKDTSLEVASLAYPDVKPMVLTDYHRTWVKKGELPSEAVRVTPEEVDRMLGEFIITPSEVGVDMPVAVREEKIMEGGVPVPFGILFPPTELVPPEFPGEAMAGEGFALPDFMKGELSKESMRSILDRRDYILTEEMTRGIKRYILQRELPGMPGEPK